MASPQKILHGPQVGNHCITTIYELQKNIGGFPTSYRLLSLYAESTRARGSADVCGDFNELLDDFNELVSRVEPPR